MGLLEEFQATRDLKEGLVAKDIAKFMIEKAFSENPEEPPCPIALSYSFLLVSLSSLRICN